MVDGEWKALEKNDIRILLEISAAGLAGFGG
jgi:hypothetical protein